MIVPAYLPYYGRPGPNQNATWHSCCVAAWNLWIAPSDHVRHLKVLQKRRCLATGERRSRMPRPITTFPCSRSGTTIAIDRGLHCWPSGASRTCRSSIDPLTWRSAPKRRASAGPMKWTPERGQSMCAAFCCFICGSAAAMPQRTALMFTSIIRSHSSIWSRSSGACGMSPALLMITSIRPYACTAASTNSLTCWRSVTLVVTAVALPPLAVSSRANDSIRS